MIFVLFQSFLKGYYLIVVTKRKQVASIGAHAIYRVEDTIMISLFSKSVAGPDLPEEERYRRIFHNVDLTSNFYFSHTYDLTRPVQSNMYLPSDLERQRLAEPKPPVLKPDETFLWNHFLLHPFHDTLRPEWLISLTHGFVSQSDINIYGRHIYVTLIARRSRHYAGTRFLKRGCDNAGHCANHVESEQIVHDASEISHRRAFITSYIQMRGSVPVHWEQDHAGMKAKPPISIARADPFASAAAMHFERLFHKFGAPIIAFDLVKKKERRPRESILLNAYTAALGYLNKFLPKESAIQHVSWDMAKSNKSREPVVLRILDQYAQHFLKQQGIFTSRQRLSLVAEADAGLDSGHGVVRVNCVDCLDRTNTAQFMIGLCALRHQLFELGVIADTQASQIPPDSPVNRVLEEMYEDHGDTIALQYGGSQLVNRIQSYRKTRPWTSNSRDILNTVARYYSNSFTDADKQMAINLFLGKYVPLKEDEPLWLQYSDYFLHYPHA
ncbi:uncharacterized protein MONBRDRAFT_15000, partial [Monosiga brevicollis MX1]